MWISHTKAVVIIADDLSITIAQAYKVLIQACECCVHSRYPLPPTRIADAFDLREEWREISHEEWREVSGRGHTIRLSDGAVTSYDRIEIDLDSLGLWIASQLEVRREPGVDAKRYPKDERIRQEMRIVIEEEQAAGRRPPNNDELAAAVQPRLQEQGFQVTRRQITTLGKEPEFQAKRLPRGRPKTTTH